MKLKYHEIPKRDGGIRHSGSGKRQGIEENFIRELYRRSREKLMKSFDSFEEGFFPGDLCDVAIGGRRIC
ncbi:MAG: hypothetical protein LBQ88_06010 [Treponema sp.]|jgi:hypothetical protein|nr:hypothetical protein [Treponema sp.]